MSIYLMGDSISQGVVYDEKRARLALSGERYGQRIEKERGVGVKNLSKIGATLARGEELLQRQKFEKGDVVLVEYGGNDCDYIWSEVADRPDEAHLCRTPPDSFRARYIRLIQGIRALGASPVVMTLPPLIAERYFAFITRNLNAAAILRFLGDVAQIYRWQELYSQTALKAAQQLSCPVADVRAAFLSARNMPHLICADGIHPNEKGQELIARVVLGTI